MTETCTRQEGINRRELVVLPVVEQAFAWGASQGVLEDIVLVVERGHRDSSRRRRRPSSAEVMVDDLGWEARPPPRYCG